MNLYEKTAYDSPFGFGSQEWLDRKGDIDDAALDQRLARLLPDVLVNDTNAALKRRLFSIESWELNTWAAPVTTMGTVFGVPAANPKTIDGNWQEFDSTGTLPALMHGGRKINLNLPLPVSDDPREAVRQKWCRDTYQAFKCILYPPDGSFPAQRRNAVPADELAAIGQFAVNVVDFRDPDSTMTEFLNYDLVEAPAIISDVAGTAANAFQTPPPPVPVITVPAGVGRYTGAPPNNTPLSQWGMEYNPIGITEVLGYQFTRKDTTTKATT